MLKSMYAASILASSPHQTDGLRELVQNHSWEAQAQRPTSQRWKKVEVREVVQLVPNVFARVTCRSTCPRHRAEPVHPVRSMCPRLALLSHHIANGNEARNRWVSRSQFSRSWSTWQVIAEPTCTFVSLLEDVPFPEPTSWAFVFQVSKVQSDAFVSSCLSVASGAPAASSNCCGRREEGEGGFVGAG